MRAPSRCAYSEDSRQGAAFHQVFRSASSHLDFASLNHAAKKCAMTEIRNSDHPSQPEAPPPSTRHQMKEDSKPIAPAVTRNSAPPGLVNPFAHHKASHKRKARNNQTTGISINTTPLPLPAVAIAKIISATYANASTAAVLDEDRQIEFRGVAPALTGRFTAYSLELVGCLSGFNPDRAPALLGDGGCMVQ